MNKSAAAVDLLYSLFTTDVIFSLYNFKKLEKIKKICVLAVNADKMIKSEHIRETQKSSMNCCFTNLMSYIR